MAGCVRKAKRIRSSLKNKKKSKVVFYTKIRSKYTQFGPFLTIFEQYEEFDGETLERVWQSLFKVYNQTLRKKGDNDFSVEHTEVSKRQRDGTLERVVKYDKEALDKAWEWMASSPSDDEEE